ncbi:MAG: flagellar biosynthetic protein FliO [Gammaproteobacteria bacterium]
MVRAALLAFFAPALSAASGELPKPASSVVSGGNVASWVLGLLTVLAVLFLCVWLLRKMNVAGMVGPGKMRVLGGLSLGVKEKVVLLEVGQKQLLLGVTPGRIENLCVLEGDDRLADERSVPDRDADAGFADKLRLAMGGGAK